MGPWGMWQGRHMCLSSSLSAPLGLQLSVISLITHFGPSLLPWWLGAGSRVGNWQHGTLDRSGENQGENRNRAFLHQDPQSLP